MASRGSLFISVFLKTMVSRVLLVIIFTGNSYLPPALLLRVLWLHINGIMGIYIHITESKTRISYLKHHDSTLMLSSIIFTCHSVQPSSISLLRVGNTISIRSPFCVTKLQNIVLVSHRLAAFHSQRQWTLILLSLPTPKAMEALLEFKRHRESHSLFTSMFSKTLVSTLISVNIFTGRPSFMDARGAHKRHHGCN